MNLNLNEKFRGSFYGGAIGDALGLGTEFMTPAEIKIRYKDGLDDYSRIVRDAHRSQWNPGEWTNDTEVLIMMMETIIERGDVDSLQFANALYRWFIMDPIDVVPQVRWVVSQPDYLEHPMEVAERVWLEMGQHHASNEALQRSILCGAWIRRADLCERVSEVCRITHPDTRCICSATILAHLAHELIYHDRIMSMGELLSLAEKIDRRVCPYIDLARCEDIAELDLANPDKLWYVRKCMACAIWALYHTSSPAEALEAVIMAGGDADTNAAVSMNLVGLRDGLSSLPKHLLDGLVFSERMIDVADRFYPKLEKRFNEIAAEECKL